MKYLWLLAVLFCALLFAKEPSLHYLTVLKQYSPDGYYLVRRAVKRTYRFGQVTITADPAASYVDASSNKTLRRTLPLAVHEAAHLYSEIEAARKLYENKEIVEPGRAFCYYSGKQKSVFVRSTSSFPFENLKADLKKEKYAFRYKALLKNETSKQYGIYELLDEWNAYYWQSRVALELLPLYENEIETESYIDFFQDFSAHITGVLEMRLYMLIYLQKAQTEYPNIYTGAQNNREFRLMVKHLDQLSLRLYRDYFRTKAVIAQKMKKERVRVEERQGQITFVFADNSQMLVENQSEEYMYYVNRMKTVAFSRVARDFGLKVIYPVYGL